jgi:voltage-gated potassium channel
VAVLIRAGRKAGEPAVRPGGIQDARHQLKSALILLLLVVTLSTVGYMALEDWSFLDSLFMTVITLATIGYGEVHPLSSAGQVFTIVVILLGVGTAAYTLGTASKLMVEDRIRILFGRKTMKALQSLHDHYILCGFGRMGRTVAAELADRAVPFVVVENKLEVIDDLDRLGYLYIKGDATEDDVLIEAGIGRAKGLVSVVTSDSHNVYIVLSARGLNPRLAIVARADSDESIQKLVRAGANRVISPYSLSGFRIAQAVHSPTVLDFLEKIVHDKALGLRLDEVLVQERSRLAGASVASSGLRQEHDLIILAIKDSAGKMAFNPASDTVLRAGDTLVVLGHLPNLKKLEKIAAG